jgi:tetratricopeptide (TPR) repeat protein
MKNQILVYLIILSLHSFHSWSQTTLLNEKKIEKTLTTVTILNNETDIPARKVKYYHVEEIIYSQFGGHKTVYNVSNPKLIQTNDLGPNSKRIITPIFEKSKPVLKTTVKLDTLKRVKNHNDLSIDGNTRKIATLKLMQKEGRSKTSFKIDTANKMESSNKISSAESTAKEDTDAYVDIIKTYESVVEKGFETIEILKILANSYFFDTKLEKAEKYYRKLFNKTTDLEPEYYYRYSVALKSIGQIEKSNGYLKKFNQLSNTSIVK